MNRTLLYALLLPPALAAGGGLGFLLLGFLLGAWTGALTVAAVCAGLLILSFALQAAWKGWTAARAGKPWSALRRAALAWAMAIVGVWSLWEALAAQRVAAALLWGVLLLLWLGLRLTLWWRSFKDPLSS